MSPARIIQPNREPIGATQALGPTRLVTCFPHLPRGLRKMVLHSCAGWLSTIRGPDGITGICVLLRKPMERWPELVKNIRDHDRATLKGDPLSMFLSSLKPASIATANILQLYVVRLPLPRSSAWHPTSPFARYISNCLRSLEVVYIYFLGGTDGHRSKLFCCRTCF